MSEGGRERGRREGEKDEGERGDGGTERETGGEIETRREGR